MMIAELCLDTDSADLVAMSIVVNDYSNRICEQITQTQTVISGDTPRARILRRKAEQRRRRVKHRRPSRRQ
jgi:hypothetical protein